MTKKTIKAESSAADAKEFFDVVREVSDKSFKKAEAFSEKYIESMAALRRETLHVWQEGVTASLDLQAEFARKAGVTPKVPSEIEEMIRAGAETWASAENELVRASIDVTKQLVQTYGAAAKAATELSRSALGFWVSAFNAKPASQSS